MKKVKLIPYILLVIALTGGSFSFGVYYGQETFEPQVKVVNNYIEVPVVVEVAKEVPPKPPPITLPITIERSLQILEEGRYSHQYYVDYPELINDSVGTLSHHKYWIEMYDQIERLIIELARTRY